jgi:hypothetical protein
MIKGVRDLDEKLDMRPKIENRYRSVGTKNSEERVVRVRLRSGARKRRDLAFRFRLTEKKFWIWFTIYRYFRDTTPHCLLAHSLIFFHVIFFAIAGFTSQLQITTGFHNLAVFTI